MILESLPPIVPSIGIGAPLRASTTTANADNNVPDDPTSHDHDSSAIAVVPPPYIRLGNRTIYTSSTARPWSWKAFSSTARADDAQFHHWVPSSIEYADYPYARFDVHLDPLIYTNEEYEKYLEEDGNVVVIEEEGKDRIDLLMRNNNRKQQRQHLVHSKVYPWTKSETDALLELARAYDLRWPVIVDKWKCQFANVPSCHVRQIEDLQYRYYQVGAILAVKRAEEVLTKEVESIDRNSKEEEETSTKKERNVTVPPSTAVLASGTIKGGEGDTTVAVVNGAPMAKHGENALVSTPFTNNVDTTANPMVSLSSTSLNQPPPPPPPPPDKEVIEALHRTHRQLAIDPSLAIPPLSLPATGTSTHRLRGSNGGGIVTGVGNVVKGAVFDLAAERARRAQLDRLWHRSKEEEMEEEGLRAELRIVEAQLRKLKRSGKHLVPAGSASAASNAATVSTAGGAKFVMPGGVFGGGGREDDVVIPASSSSSGMLPPPSSRTMMPPPPLSSSSSSHRPPLDPFSTTHQSVSASFVETAPVPTPGTPYLQSGRLFPPSVKGHSGLNPSTLKQMNAILRELNIPEEPIPTKRNCDLYDGVRKDALTLLILQKIALRKEVELDSKRSMLIEIMSAAAAAKTAAEESEKYQKKNEENATQEKEGGNEAEGEKGKRGAAKKAKAKRLRDDSASSNQGGVSSTTASKGGGKGRDSTPKEEGSAPKKRPRTKAKKDTSTVAAPASTPTASSNSLSTAALSVVPAATNVPPLPHPPPIGLPSSAPISPMVTTGRSARPSTDLSSMLPSSMPLPPLRNNVGASSSSAVAAACHSGNTSNKPGKKPRDRKKES